MMKLTFISNYYTHHQQALCEAWDDLTSHQFEFIATKEFSEDRKQLGWGEPSDVPFVKQYGAVFNEADASILRSDVVILGDAPLDLVAVRLADRKMVFQYAERIFKRGYQPLKWLPRLYRYWQRYGRHRSLYLLCASAYTAIDYAMHGAFLGKAYRWGYFPETRHYDVDLLIAQKNPVKILWCGRLIDWKHPDAVLEVTKRLLRDGLLFEVDFIGKGDLEPKLREAVEASGLSDCVRFLGTMDPQQVRAHMEKAGIYLFTSDFQEGWGAVLNESMNSGCAVVASHAIGSVPYLLKHGENGLIYKNGDTDTLYQHVRYLLEHPQVQRQLGEKAYHTIADLWNAEVAAERFLKLSEALQTKGTCDLYKDGPCSPAPILRNHWFKGETR